MAKRRPKHAWQAWEEEAMRRLFPESLTADLAKALGLSVYQVTNKAFAMGLRKRPETIAHLARERSKLPGHGGAATRFQKGVVPWNTGTHFVAGGRSAETRFKAGRPAAEARNYLPIGSLRLTADGYLERKVTDDPALVPARRWVAVHRLVWEQANGPVPKGMAVVFKAGQKTTKIEDLTLNRLECISRRELMQRNSVHTMYPPELARVVQLRGALTRAVNRRAKEAES